MKIYVAYSYAARVCAWRNSYRPEVVRALRDRKHDVYDCRDASGAGKDPGSNWADIDPGWQSWSTRTFAAALNHPIAQRGYQSDFDAMQWAEACVLLLPCGGSAYLEAGYFVGAGKPLLILLDMILEGEVELMYKLATRVVFDVRSLLLLLDEIGDGASHTETDG